VGMVFDGLEFGSVLLDGTGRVNDGRPVGQRLPGDLLTLFICRLKCKVQIFKLALTLLKCSYVMPIQEEQIDGASARLCSEENIMDIYIYTLLPLFKINRLLSWE
jgi:hypothetical protein